MNPENVCSAFLIGDNLDYILFKCAFFYAERGLSVWFISPEPLTAIPDKISTPSRDILNLITFLYLREFKDLVNQLSRIHLWHKKPQVIILNSYDVYCDLKISDGIFSVQKLAFLNSILVDAAATCPAGTSDHTLVLVSCQECEKQSLVKRLARLSFSYVVTRENGDECDELFEEIIKLLH